MPNWCSNAVSFYGSLEDVTNLVHALSVADEKETSLRWMRFEALFPRPEGLDGGDACNWSVAQWGTKWDLADHEGELSITYNDVTEMAGASTGFETAWGPPITFFERVATKFPNVTIAIEFDEPGMDFWGEVTWRDGEVVHTAEGPSKQNIALREEWADEEDGDVHWPGDECDESHVMMGYSSDGSRWLVKLDCSYACSNDAGHEDAHHTTCPICKGDWKAKGGTCGCTRRLDP